LKNIQLVGQLEHWFAFDDKAPPLLDEDGTIEVRSSLEEQLSQTIARDPGSFAAALSRAEPGPWREWSIGELAMKGEH
jgi:hypothetical protein